MPSRFTENNIGVNEKQSVFVITNGENIISFAYMLLLILHPKKRQDH